MKREIELITLLAAICDMWKRSSRRHLNFVSRSEWEIQKVDIGQNKMNIG